jgi:hypothetical protein
LKVETVAENELARPVGSGKYINKCLQDMSINLKQGNQWMAFVMAHD